MRARPYTHTQPDFAQRAPMPSTPVYNSRGEPAKEPMTFEEFLEWVDESTRAEWVNGRVELMTPVNMQHQDIVLFLASIIRPYVEERQLGRLIAGPAGFKSAVVPSFREPDLFFVSDANAHKILYLYLDAPPDLAVEVVSPHDRKRDVKDKFEEYARGGVREYWLIEPDRESAEFYTLGANGRYVRVPVGADGIYRSQVLPGFFLRVAWLWMPPPMLTVLRELGVV